MTGNWLIFRARILSDPFFPFYFFLCLIFTGTGPKRVYQFKLIEKEPWGQEPKQLAKLGSVDLKVIKFLRKEIADRVASKF